MKTQINHLRCGKKRQILNVNVDYSILPKATRHLGHSGSNSVDVKDIWEAVIRENPKALKAKIKGVELKFTASYSASGKSVNYYAIITREQLREVFGVTRSKRYEPYICISNANYIEVCNGANGVVNICPSFVEIL